MALKHVCLVLGLAAAVAACSRSAVPPAEQEEPEVLDVTRWTGKSELFAEYPPLAVGQTSRFAIHLTRLDSFKPITDGRVEVYLRGSTGASEVFRADAPSRPGIFGVDVRPVQAGKRELVIVLRASGLEDEHAVGQVDVHANAEAARQAATGDGEAAAGISFLKEQQWSLDFRTALVREESLRESIRVPAMLHARPGGSADVVAPIDGRLTRVLDVALGASVARGQELGRLLPPPAVPGNLPQLQGARAEAQAALSFTSRDRERAERLVNAGAAPEKRLDEARAAEEQAKARLNTADAGLRQYNASRTADAGGLEEQFVVRAPIAGVVSQRDAATGANVTAGTVLFRIVDVSQVQIVGLVPESDAARARLVTSAEMEIPGRDDRVLAGRLVAAAKVLDPRSRKLPITFAFDNRVFALPVGQTVVLHLLMDMTAPRPVVPAAAIVDDAGRPIVFVQRGGETFERRPVTVGARSGDLVQIAEGVKPGDRVVTKGAYLVRLAALSTSVPAHGHVH